VVAPVETPTPFTVTLATLIQRLTHVPVTASDFDLGRVPAHLRMTFRGVDDHGRSVAEGMDLADLQRRLGSRARESVAAASVAAAPNPIERTGLTSWDFTELPRFIDTKQGGNTIRAYPTLIDEGASAAIRLMSTEAEQARLLPGGVRRLLLLATPSPVA
jgi:ATP-dependent helicase HrpA